MRNSLLKAGVAVAALLILPANGFAACATSSTSAQVQSSSAATNGANGHSTTTTASNAEVQANNEAVKEIVDNAKVDPETGDVEASTGPAKPTENWLGCPPDNDEPRCQTPEGQAEMRQEAEAKAKSGSGKDGSINAKAGLQADAKASADPACADNKTAG
jgi:hypothetical protein